MSTTPSEYNGERGDVCNPDQHSDRTCSTNNHKVVHTADEISQALPSNTMKQCDIAQHCSGDSSSGRLVTSSAGARSKRVPATSSPKAASNVLKGIELSPKSTSNITHRRKQQTVSDQQCITGKVRQQATASAQEHGQMDMAVNGSSRREQAVATNARNAVVAAAKNQMAARLESRQLAAQERRQQRDTELKKKMNQLRLEQERKQELVTRRQNEKNIRTNTSTTPKAPDHPDGHQPPIKQKDNLVKPHPSQLSSRIQNVVNRLAIPKRNPAQLSCESPKGAVRSPTTTNVTRTSAVSKAERDPRHAPNQISDARQVRKTRAQTMVNVKRSGDEVAKTLQAAKVDGGVDKLANGKNMTNLMTRSTIESQMDNIAGRQARISSEHVDTTNGNVSLPLVIDGDEEPTTVAAECSTESDNFVEYQRKLEENRRIARERLEDERRRMEQEQSAREEEEKRAELELIRLQEDAKEAESARMLAAIADQQRIAQEKANQERIEQEQKAEQERNRTEESHRMQEQRQRRLREEETRREARKKTVEDILNSIRLHDDTRIESQRALPTLDVSGSESINRLLQSDFISAATSEVVKSYLSRSCYVGLNTSDCDFDTALLAKPEGSSEACTTNSAYYRDDIEPEANDSLLVTASAEDVDANPKRVVENDHTASCQEVSEDKSSVQSVNTSPVSSDGEFVMEREENLKNSNESGSFAFNAEMETVSIDEQLPDLKCTTDKDIVATNSEDIIPETQQAENADHCADEVLNVSSSEFASYTDSSENIAGAPILDLSNSELTTSTVSSEGENIKEICVLIENDKIIGNEERSHDIEVITEGGVTNFNAESTFKEEVESAACHSPVLSLQTSTVNDIDDFAGRSEFTSDLAAKSMEETKDKEEWAKEEVNKEEMVANEAPFVDEENSTYLTCDTLMLAECDEATVCDLDASCDNKGAVQPTDGNGLMTIESALICDEVMSDLEQTTELLIASSGACSNDASEVMCGSSESTNDVSESHYDKSTSDHLSENSAGLMNGNSENLCVSSVSEDETKILDDHIRCAMDDGDSTSDDQESAFETTYSMSVNIGRNVDEVTIASNNEPAIISCSSEASSDHADASINHARLEENSSAELVDVASSDKLHNVADTLTTDKTSDEQVEGEKAADLIECCPLVEDKAEDKESEKES